MNEKISRRDSLKFLAGIVGGISLINFPLFPQQKVSKKKKKQKNIKSKEDVIKDKTFYRDYKLGDIIYNNPLQKDLDLKDFKLEGYADISFPHGRMRMENKLDASLRQKANFVFWCNKKFPSDIAVSWDFYPVQEPGLCIMFFAAEGTNGEDIFDPKLAKRTGEYKQYHHGDINTYHISYFRRRGEAARALHLCNLRKSYGSNIVCQGADPIPTVADARPPYNLRLVKAGNSIELFINELSVLHWIDDGKKYGPVLKNGKIGFRQMAPLVAEYANFQVHHVKKI